jgi:Tol biopolymer transport system component
LIAFVGASQESPTLFVANRRGKALRRLPLPRTSARTKKELRWTGEFGGVRWSSSGRYVATVREVEPWYWKQVFWDLEKRRYWTAPAQDYGLPVWSPRRDEYVTHDTFGYKPPFRIVLRDPKTKTTKVLLSAKASINYVEWSPTGRQLLYTLAEKTDSEDQKVGDPNLRGIWTVRSDGKEAKRIYFPQRGDTCGLITWSPSGDRITFLKSAVKSASAKKGEELIIQIIRASDGKAVKSFRLKPPGDWKVCGLYWRSEEKFLVTLRRDDPNDPNTKPPRYSLAVFDTDRGTSKVLIEEMGNSDFDVHPHRGW